MTDKHPDTDAKNEIIRKWHLGEASLGDLVLKAIAQARREGTDLYKVEREAIASEIQYWLDYQVGCNPGKTLGDETHIYVLPVNPTRHTLKLWVKVLRGNSND